MIHIENHKIKAIALYIIVVLFEWLSGGQKNGTEVVLILSGLLLPILFSEVFAFFSSFGFMESYASDSRDGVSPNTISFLGWILFLLGCTYFLFNLNM